MDSIGQPATLIGTTGLILGGAALYHTYNETGKLRDDVSEIKTNLSATITQVAELRKLTENINQLAGAVRNLDERERDTEKYIEYIANSQEKIEHQLSDVTQSLRELIIFLSETVDFQPKEPVPRSKKNKKKKKHPRRHQISSSDESSDKHRRRKPRSYRREQDEDDPVTELRSARGRR